MNSANARFLLNWVSFERSSILNCSSNVQKLRCAMAKLHVTGTFSSLIFSWTACI